MHLVSDLCNRVLTSSKTSLNFVVVLNSKVVRKIVFAVWKLGFLAYFVIFNIKFLKIHLKYFSLKKIIRAFFSISKPSSRIYLKKKMLQLIKFLNQYLISGFFLISTPKGLYTDIECLMAGQGGEAVIFVA